MSEHTFEDFYGDKTMVYIDNARDGGEKVYIEVKEETYSKCVAQNTFATKDARKLAAKILELCDEIDGKTAEQTVVAKYGGPLPIVIANDPTWKDYIGKTIRPVSASGLRFSVEFAPVDVTRCWNGESVVSAPPMWMLPKLANAEEYGGVYLPCEVFGRWQIVPLELVEVCDE